MKGTNEPMLVKEESPLYWFVLPNGSYGMPLRTHLCQEIGCHRLAINNEVGQMQTFGGLFIVGKHLGHPVG